MKYSEKAFLWLRASAGLHPDLEKKILKNKSVTLKDIENMRQVYFKLHRLYGQVVL
jgi:hypothetical protein